MQLCIVMEIREHNDVADVVMDGYIAMVDEFVVFDLVEVPQSWQGMKFENIVIGGRSWPEIADRIHEAMVGSEECKCRPARSAREKIDAGTAVDPVVIARTDDGIVATIADQPVAAIRPVTK
jgi:hypothetical protein